MASNLSRRAQQCINAVGRLGFAELYDNFSIIFWRAHGLETGPTIPYRDIKPVLSAMCSRLDAIRPLHAGHKWTPAILTDLMYENEFGERERKIVRAVGEVGAWLTRRRIASVPV